MFGDCRDSASGKTMTVQIDQIFTARAESVWQFLHAAGQGCYIPAYQRPYAWDSENVDRLIDDVLNGLNHLVDRSSAISFLGTIIAIHDTNLVTVKPVYQAEVAQRVMTLIDGQQRISTSVMMNIVLHHHTSTLIRASTDLPSILAGRRGKGPCGIIAGGVCSTKKQLRRL